MRLDRDGIDRSPLDRSGDVTVFAVYLTGVGSVQVSSTGTLNVAPGEDPVLVPTTPIPAGPGVITDRLMKMFIEERRIKMAILNEIVRNTT